MFRSKWLFVVLGAMVAIGQVKFATAQDLKALKSSAGKAIVVGPDGKKMIVNAPPATSAPPSRGPRPEDGKKPEEKKDESSNDKDDSKDKKSEEEEKTTEPILRSADPPDPPDPKELEVRPVDGRVHFNFTGQPWPAVLQWLADVSQMSLDWQELPGDYLNLTTQRDYTLEETRDLINRHLLARGYTLLRHGEVLSVAKLESINPAMVPRVEPDELESRDMHEFVKVSFELDWMLAETAVAEIEPMLSEHGKLNPLKATNRIEAIDVVLNLREIQHLLSMEQSAEAEEQLFAEFTLRYAKAEDVREQLTGLLGLESKSSKPSMPMSSDQMRQMQEAARRQAQQQAQQKGGASKTAPKPEPVNLVVNLRRNSILVHAPPDKMAIIQKAVEAIDVPIESSGSILLSMHQMQIYRLAAIDPEPLVKTLDALGQLDPKTHLEVDDKNNAIIAYAPAADHVVIRALVGQLDGSGRSFEVIPLRRLPADYVAGTIEFMMVGEKEEKSSSSSRYYYGYGSSRSSQSKDDEGKFRVDADLERNRLLLWANPIELEEVTSLLVKLGEIPPEGGDTSKIRVLDGSWGPETDDWLERVRQAWPSVAPNPLELTDEAAGEMSGGTKSQNEDPNEEEKEKKDQDVEKDEKDIEKETAAPLPITTISKRPLIHLAQFRREEPIETEPAETEPAEAKPAETEKSQEASEPPAAKLPTSPQVPRDPISTPPSTDPRSVPPVVQISRGPDGRVVIASEDPRALDALEDLMHQLAPPKNDYELFRLKYAWAYGVALTLEDIFEEEEKEDSKSRYPYYFYDHYGSSKSDNKSDQRRLSQRRPLKFIADPDTNSILVQNADSTQLAKIETLIEFYDQPEPIDSQSVRKTEIVPLHFAKASTVADVVKDVYRDLLSANDKALVNSQQKQGARESYTFVYDAGDGQQQERAPRFKGLLSIGINEVANTLVISAPVHLWEDISGLIDQLDQAAKPAAETVHLLQLSKSTNAAEIHQKLSRLLGNGQGGRGINTKGMRQPNQPLNRFKKTTTRSK